MFSKQLKKYRIKRNIKQSSLAEQIYNKTGICVKDVNISSWERGVNPKIEIIEAIAEILDIPVQYLFDDSDKAINKILQDRYEDVFKYRKNLKNINSIIKKVLFDFTTIEELSDIK